MASPSDHQTKEGLRCSKKKVVRVKKSPEARFPGPAVGIAECGGLVLEQDPERGLGSRCFKKDCREFHPLEVLLGQAIAQNFLSPEQLDVVRKVVNEEKSEDQPVYPEPVYPEQSRRAEGEEEMTTATKHSIEINPQVHLAIDPAGAIEAMEALSAKRTDIYNELIERHFPTFSSGELKARAGRFIGLLAQGDVKRVEIEVTLDERSNYVTWLKIFFRNRKSERFQDGGWSKLEIARDAAYRFQSFANLLEVQVVLRDKVDELERC